MKKTWIALLTLLMSTFTFAGNKAPIQRIDVTNLLWNSAAGGDGGLTHTSVTVDFSNGGITPCYSKTLAFQEAITVFAGVGLPCVAAINEIAINTVAAPIGLVYLAPSNVTLNTALYFAQLEVNQLTAPAFDPSNATLLAPGTATTTFANY